MEKTFNGETLTDETIQKTREWFHANTMTSIEEAKRGKFFVSNLDNYTKWRTELANEYMEGKYDHVLAFLQRAHYIQTGESIPLLPF